MRVREKKSRALTDLVKKVDVVLCKAIKALIIQIICTHIIVYDHWFIILYYITRVNYNF